MIAETTIDFIKMNEEKSKGLCLRLNDGRFLGLRKKVKEYANSHFDAFLADIFYRCFFNTIDTTSYFEDDGTVFVLTGDIPAMWLRDSAAQVMHYLYFANGDKEVCDYVKGVMKRQFIYMILDPYANAFKRTENSYGEWDDRVITDRLEKIVWERKFELDSLCYPFFLACKYFERTSDASCFDETFIRAFDVMMHTVYVEQKHSERSSYRFCYRNGGYKVGVSNPNEEKGLVWCGFRASDDVCTYNYHIPDNMFLTSVLYKLATIFRNNLLDFSRAEKCERLANELREKIDKYGVVRHEKFGKIYVSETNCVGGYHVDDDANIPSLLSIPYLEYPFIDKQIYKNTRDCILSSNNVYYYEGNVLTGIGSPHTPKNHVWPLSLCMQAITSADSDEIIKIVNMLKNSTAGTGYMHESIHKDDDTIYSRPWFAWANSLFAYLLLDKKDVIRASQLA